jgi:hypothetical protein
VVTEARYHEQKKLKGLAEVPTSDPEDVAFLPGSDLWTRVARGQLACYPTHPWLQEEMSLSYLSVIAFLPDGSGV